MPKLEERATITESITQTARLMEVLKAPPRTDRPGRPERGPQPEREEPPSDRPGSGDWEDVREAELPGEGGTPDRD